MTLSRAIDRDADVTAAAGRRHRRRARHRHDPGQDKGKHQGNGKGNGKGKGKGKETGTTPGCADGTAVCQGMCCQAGEVCQNGDGPCCTAQGQPAACAGRQCGPATDSCTGEVYTCTGCAGCCEGTTCNAGTSKSACGKDGLDCRPCPGAEICVTSRGVCGECETSANCETGLVCDATHFVCRSCASRDECAPTDDFGNRFCEPLGDGSGQSRCTNLQACGCPGNCGNCGPELLCFGLGHAGCEGKNLCCPATPAL